MNPNESILCIVYYSNDFISVSIQFNQIQSEATFKSKQYEMSTILENTNSVCGGVVYWLVPNEIK